MPQADKEALFAACVARTVKGQLAFEPQARPELEATIARLDIDFAKHIRPTAAMYWSRIVKSRVLDIARTVFGLAWASARSKYKKPALAEAMEAAFAAGEPPVGVSAAMHAKALAWVPPGFAAFDTGRTVGAGEEHGDAELRRDRTGREPEPAEPAADAGTDPAEAAPVGNGHATEADPAPPRRTARRRMTATAPPTRSTPVGRRARRGRGDRSRPGRRGRAGRHRRDRSGQRARRPSGPDGDPRVPPPRPVADRKPHRNAPPAHHRWRGVSDSASLMEVRP